MGGDAVAVVREEDDCRVVVKPVRLQHPDDAAHLAVGTLHQTVIGIKIAPPVVLRVGVGVVVAGRGGVFERQRFGRIGRGHEIGREIGTLVGGKGRQFAVVQRFVASVFADFVGIEQRSHQKKRLLSVVLLQRRVAGVGQRRVVHLRDTAESRARIGEVDLRDVPFPSVEAFVTRLGEAVADAGLHIGVGGAYGVVEGPDLEGHAPRDERSAAGTAQRIGAVGPREPHAVGGQRIHCRGPDPRIAGARHGSGSLLVGHDDDDGGTFPGGGFGFRSGGGIGSHGQSGERRGQRSVVETGHRCSFSVIQNYHKPAAKAPEIVPKNANRVQKPFDFVESNFKFVLKPRRKALRKPPFDKSGIGLHKTETPLQKFRKGLAIINKRSPHFVVPLQ